VVPVELWSPEHGVSADSPPLPEMLTPIDPETVVPVDWPHVPVDACPCC
jgi:hypothetical protein